MYQGDYETPPNSGRITPLIVVVVSVTAADHQAAALGKRTQPHALLLERTAPRLEVFLLVG